MPTRTFREFDHSGDVGIEAWGETKTELFENMTRGLLSLLARGHVGNAVEHQVEVVSNNDADLVVDWLSEVIAATATSGMTWSDVAVMSVAGGRARGTLLGEPTKSARHDLRFDVKAATYHRLLFERTPSGFHARVVFDL